MVGWAVELSEFGLCYDPRGSVKGQHLADFTTKLPLTTRDEWNLYVHEALGCATSGVGILLEGLNGFLLKHSLIFKFKVSNNQAEYKALIAGLELGKDIGAWKVTCRTNSQLVVGQMNRDFKVEEDQFLKYFHKASALARSFDKIVIQHIPREKTLGWTCYQNLASERKKDNSQRSSDKCYSNHR